MLPAQLFRYLIALLPALILPWPVSVSAAASPPPEIEYASPDQSVWTTHSNKQGEPDNPLNSVAAVLFTKAGIPWHSRAYPATRMFKYLQDGTVHFSILVRSPALQECCLLSRKPLTFVEIHAYHRAGTPPIKSVNDLLGKSVITIHGYSYGGLLALLGEERNRTGNNLTLTHAAAFHMLAQERADYVIDYAGPASEVLAATPIPGLQSELLSRQEVFLVLSKQYPDAEKLMSRFEKIAETLDVDTLIRRSKR
jgi:polar amino acid transport system substrate-binding protein